MKISSIHTNNMINAYNKQKQQGPAENNNKVGKDKVVISDNAKYLNKINLDSENIDIDKINKIKNRIKNGTYKVDSRNIAKKIIDDIRGD